jgi:integrase
VPPLICVVCKKPFRRPPNLVAKAKVCTSKGVKHTTTYKKMPDGQVKRVSCSCCLCVYKSTFAKHPDLDGKMIPTAKVEAVLRKAKELYGEDTWLAFRLGINAMLRVRELASLNVEDLHADAKRPYIEVVALKKKVQMRFKVYIEPQISVQLRRWLGKRPDGNLFGIAKRTLQERFKKVAHSVGLAALSIHSLRHTGVSIRARVCKSPDEFRHVQYQARHEDINTTYKYVGFEEAQMDEMAKRMKWR